jgi:3-oxoacyl-[acyl-carrier-protein] synthase II
MIRIPITGIGVLSPGATGVDAFRELLASGASAISEIDRFDMSGLSATRAGLIRNFVGRDFIAPMKMRRMNTLSRYAMASAKMALDDSGQPLPQTAGLAAATAFGPVQTSMEYMQEYVEKGAALSPPQLFAESVANAPGSHIAIEYDLRGFNVTFTQRESSALTAAMYAAAQIGKGAADAAMIGGAEEVNEMLFGVLDRIGAMAAGSDAAMRPFDLHRDGLLPGEGGAFLVARKNADGGKVYGYLSGFGIGRDRTATVSNWGTDSASVAAAMRSAIDDAGISVADINAVYVSANGSRGGDALEAAALREVFGEDLPAIVATKGYFGEYSAGGTLHLATALLAVADGVLHASCGFGTLDPALGIRPTTAQESRALRHVLVNSISAGGGIVCAVISKEPA